MSNTPRTDAFLRCETDMTATEFARTLERELADEAVGTATPDDAYAEQMREALEALLKQVTNIEVLGEWEALDINTKSRKAARAKVDAVVATARAALAKNPTDKAVQVGAKEPTSAGDQVSTYAVALRDALKTSNAALSMVVGFLPDYENHAREAVNTQIAINYGVLNRSPLLVSDEPLTRHFPAPLLTTDAEVAAVARDFYPDISDEHLAKVIEVHRAIFRPNESTARTGRVQHICSNCGMPTAEERCPECGALHSSSSVSTKEK